MGRKRAFTDSTDRSTYIRTDQHENHPAELTRSNQFLSLKDACDGTSESPLEGVIVKMETKSKSKSACVLDLDGVVFGGGMQAGLPTASAAHTPQMSKNRKAFALSQEIFDDDNVERKASWLDKARPCSSPISRDQESTIDNEQQDLETSSMERRKLSDGGSRCSLENLGSRMSINTPVIQRINSNPSVNEIEQYTKQQKEDGAVDWRKSSPGYEAKHRNNINLSRQSLVAIPGAVANQLGGSCTSIGSCGTYFDPNVDDGGCKEWLESGSSEPNTPNFPRRRRKKRASQGSLLASEADLRDLAKMNHSGVRLDATSETPMRRNSSPLACGHSAKPARLSMSCNKVGPPSAPSGVENGPSKAMSETSVVSASTKNQKDCNIM